MSNFSEKRSTTLPLPSSPHCAPNTMTLPIRKPKLLIVTRSAGALAGGAGINRRTRRAAGQVIPLCYADFFMQVSEIFLGMGEEAFAQLLRSISIGKLKSFQLYERLKARL